MNQQVQVYVSNLPNNAPEKDILAYLSTAGPIKDWKFNKVQERCSVHIVYFSIQSAELARKYLGTRQFQGRDLKINYDTKKQNMSNVMANLNQLNQDENITKMINSMSTQEKDQLLKYIANVYKKQDQMLIDFFQTKPKIVQALLKKTQPDQFMHTRNYGSNYYH